MQPSFAAAMSQYRAAMCELMIQNQLMDHSKQLDMARLKLDEFYRKHDEMQRHQLYGQVLKHDSPLSELLASPITVKPFSDKFQLNIYVATPLSYNPFQYQYRT